MIATPVNELAICEICSMVSIVSDYRKQVQNRCHRRNAIEIVHDGTCCYATTITEGTK